jgi:hypothetical protein
MRLQLHAGGRIVSYEIAAGVPRVTKSRARRAYEADLRRYPRYHDGGVRPSWDALSDSSRANWEAAYA